MVSAPSAADSYGLSSSKHVCYNIPLNVWEIDRAFAAAGQRLWSEEQSSSRTATTWPLHLTIPSGAK